MLKRRDFARALAAVSAAGWAVPAIAQTAPVKLRVGTNAADNVTDLLWAKVTGMFAKADDDLTRLIARPTTTLVDGLTGR